MTRDVVIFGTGEIAEIADFYFQHDSDYNVVAFTADDEFVKEDQFLKRPLIPFSEITKYYPPDSFNMHVALSYRKLNAIRKQKYFEAKEKGYQLASYVCSRSVYWPGLKMGDNCLILENQTIQPFVEIGNNVMIWSGNHLGHGCRIKDHAYLSSHICISGHVEIGEQCFIGVNSTFKDFVKVGDRVFVTMGASVVQDLPDHSVILGAKSKILLSGEEACEKIRNRYFGIDEGDLVG